MDTNTLNALHEKDPGVTQNIMVKEYLGAKNREDKDEI